MIRHAVFLLLFYALASSALKFKVTREWKYLNFSWPDQASYNLHVSSGMYVPENNIISGIAHFEDYFYVTLPRMKNGVPATLARIPAGAVKDTAPPVEPFPSWEMNRLDDCEALQNVQNLAVDPRGRAWIIDGGSTETLSPTPANRCPPKLVVFDIKRNATATTYTFPEHVASVNSSFLYDIVVDNTDGGYAYITDNSRKDPGIVVFSLKDHRSWKFRHSKTMKADPTATVFKVSTTTISDPINVASIALGPRVRAGQDRITVDEDREVYFCPLSSLHLYSVNSGVLKNEMNAMSDGEYQGELKDYGLKGSQSIGMIMDNQGVLYYSLLATYSIARWDSRKSFQSDQKIIARDENYLEWPNSFAFDQSGNITVLVNRLNRFIYDNLDVNEVNFRLITANVGGKSYLYDQDYDYTVEQTTSSSTTTDGELPEPHLEPGNDQDPYLVPSVELHPKVEPSPEPEPEPEPSNNHDRMDHDFADSDHMNRDRMEHDRMDHSHMDHDHMEHDHMTHDASSSSPPPPPSTSSMSPGAEANLGTAKQLEENKSGVGRLVATFMGFLCAGVLFVI